MSEIFDICHKCPNHLKFLQGVLISCLHNCYIKKISEYFVLVNFIPAPCLLTKLDLINRKIT